MQKYIKKNIFLKNKIFNKEKINKKIEIHITICSKNVDVLYIYIKYNILKHFC